jgi:peptide/nickel transport system substrate-binding protein
VRDRPSAGLVSVPPSSLAAIDPETNRVIAAIPVGARPAGVVFFRGQLWVANLDDSTVSRVDPKAGRVVRTIPTGTAPIALAEGHDAVWAIGGDGIVLRIDPVFNRVVARIPTVEAGTLLSVAPRATSGVATTADAVWSVAGGYLSTPRVFRIDPGTRQAEAVIATGHGPTAIATGLGDLWVTDSFENTVSRIDESGVVESTIPVGRGASAIAVGEGAAWVVDSLDDAIVRIDPETNSVITTIRVGRNPGSIAVGASDVWVANRHDGTISRIDPTTNEVVDTIDVGSSPAGLVFAAGSVWLTSQGIARDSRAGTDSASEVARLTSSQNFQTDPGLNPAPQINYATCAKLINYPDAPAPEGTRLVPEVAASLPTRSADGRTYTFTVRRGFAFSPPLRERVTAQTFRYAIERSMHPRMSPAASAFLSDIAGVDAYRSGKAAHISGIVVEGTRLSITLVEPDPSFLARIATPAFCAVPMNTPIDPRGVQAIPSAGPYYIAEHSPNHRIVLKRNPNYHGSRPRRFREIRYTLGVAPPKGVADVLAGRSDYLADNPPVEGDAALLARYGPASDAARNGRQQYFVNPTLQLAYLALNTSRPLFSNLRMRKAVNYAIDRRALARIGSWVSGPFPSIPTDQYLPPTMPGASPTVLYPPNGDLRTAHRLVPDAHGTAVLYTCDDYPPLCRRPAQLIKENLAALGLDVDIREFPTGELFERAGTKGEPFDLIVATRWRADYADPANFLNVLLDQRIRPRGNFNLAYYRDPDFARELDRIARLTGEARSRAYAALSVEIARDAAPWVAYAVGSSRDLFSARIGCQIFQPVYGIDLAALCARN